jgi:flavin-dependent dehydrogenase
MTASRPTREHYTTIIAGSGPAGVLAAYHAAEKGPVLLAESSSLPRYKSCGGMLHRHTLRTLKEYGNLPEDIILEPRTVRFRYNDWDRKVLKVTSLELLNVDRARFDEWLTTLLPSNVELVGECALRDLEDEGEFVTVTLRVGGEDISVTCDNLIGADGGRSQVRRSLGVANTATYVTLQDFVRLDGPIEPYFDCIYMRGIGDEYAYSYIIPKGDVAIVGSVYYPRTKHPWEKQDLTLDILRSKMPQLGETVSREAAAALHLRSRSDIVPGVGRVLLTGEAGGFMSPSSGEGISYAVNSGRRAGMAVAGNNPDGALDAYTSLTADIRSNLCRKLRWLPVMESGFAKMVAGFVPTSIVSAVTEGL